MANAYFWELDVDWEYPGGNGDNYKIVPNSDKVSEIETYPLLLAAIKAAIGNKTLSIAVPGLERDMIAFTEEQAPKIWAAVDMVNVCLRLLDNFTHSNTSLGHDLRSNESSRQCHKASYKYQWILNNH